MDGGAQHAQRSRRPSKGGVFQAEGFVSDAATAVAERTFSFIASTNEVDRYGDILLQDWNLAGFNKNPVVLWAHQARELPIGRVQDFQVSADQSRSIARVELTPPGDPQVDRIAELLQLRFLNAVSVGFAPGHVEDRRDEKGRWIGSIYSQNELVELSIVNVPANASAVMLAARQLGISPAEVEAYCDPEPAAAVHGLTPRARQLAEREWLRIKYGRWIGR